MLQLLFSYCLSMEDNDDNRSIYEELANCFDNCYLLYFHLLKLPCDLAYFHLRQLDDARHNAIGSIDLNVETSDRFADNSILRQLTEVPEFNAFCERHKSCSWGNDALFLKLLLDRVRSSEVYQQFLSLPVVGRTAEARFCRDLLREVLLADEGVLENLENKNSLWTEDDVELIGQFVIKTFRRIESNDPKPIMPMFRNNDDAHFGAQLMRHAIEDMARNNEFIDDLVDSKRWDAERIASMDRVILCMAIAEAVHFPTIPTTVTMNEYIELAKNFSTANSGPFVNGVLHSAFRRLREQGLIVKP